MFVLCNYQFFFFLFQRIRKEDIKNVQRSANERDRHRHLLDRVRDKKWAAKFEIARGRSTLVEIVSDRCFRLLDRVFRSNDLSPRDTFENFVWISV